jgi:hypothetical protein
MITIALPNIEAFKISLREHADQIPYAMSRAMNESGKLAQLAVRNHTGQIFNERRAAWVNASVKITHFSNKSPENLYLSMGIHPPGGDQRADILTKFETETEKTPFAGTHVVVPIGINAGKILREGQRFRDYHLVQHGNRWMGERGAFMLPISGDRLLVLQRVDHRVRYKRHGKSTSVAKGDAQPLFLLVPRVKITPNLDFEKTVREVVERTFPMEFDRAWLEAIASAK